MHPSKMLRRNCERVLCVSGNACRGKDKGVVMGWRQANRLKRETPLVPPRTAGQGQPLEIKTCHSGSGGRTQPQEA